MLGLGLAAASAAGMGAAQLALFSRPSDLKYVVTVLVPVIAAFVVASREPVVTASFLLLVAAPFGGFNTTISGIEVPLIAPACIGALAIALVCPGEAGRPLTNPVPMALLGVLIAVPLLAGSSPAHYAGLIATIGATAFVIARACSRPGGMTIVIAGLVASAVVQASIALWQLRTGQALNVYGTAGTPVLGRDYFYQFEDVFRPSGSLYDPISLGNLLAIALPAAMALSLRARSLGPRLVWAASGVWILLALVLTLSRMSWIAGTLGVLVVVALQERGRLRALLAITGAAAIALMIGFAVDGPSLEKRLQSVIAPDPPHHGEPRGGPHANADLGGGGHRDQQAPGRRRRLRGAPQRAGEQLPRQPARGARALDLSAGARRRRRRRRTCTSDGTPGRDPDRRTRRPAQSCACCGARRLPRGDPYVLDDRLHRALPRGGSHLHRRIRRDLRVEESSGRA